MANEDLIKGELTRSVAREELNKSVQEEAGKALQSYQQSAKEIGYQPTQQKQFVEKGVRIGGKLVAQKEFEDAITAQKETIAELVKTRNFQSQEEAAKYELELNDRLNQVRRKLLEQVYSANYEMKKKQMIDQERKQGLATVIGGATSLISLGIAGFGK